LRWWRGSCLAAEWAVVTARISTSTRRVRILPRVERLHRPQRRRPPLP